MSDRKTQLVAEIRYRQSLKQCQVTLTQLSKRLRAIGYRLDRSMDCRAPARYMTGERAGQSYPALSLRPVQIDNGLSWSHVDARRDANFEALKRLRDSCYAVVRGAIAEL